MSSADNIADMLTAIRNVNMRRNEYVDINASRINEAITQILKDENYINNFRILKNKPVDLIRIYLKYGTNSNPAITNLRRISKPSLRKYVNKTKIPTVLNGKGIAILSTSKGVMTDKKARELNVGGELICLVW